MMYRHDLLDLKNSRGLVNSLVKIAWSLGRATQLPDR